MTRVFFIACMLVTWLVATNATCYHLYAELDSPSLSLSVSPSSPNSLSPSPSPSSECSALIYNMASCLPFLSNGDSKTKPDSSCCSGFNSLVKGNAECVCEAVRSRSDLSVNLNLTRAVTLFSACGISSPPISNCSIPPPPPGSSPASPAKNPPTPSPSNPSVAPAPSSGSDTPAPWSDDNGNRAPAPSPQAHDGAYTASVSFTFVISVVVASFSTIFD